MKINANRLINGEGLPSGGDHFFYSVNTDRGSTALHSVYKSALSAQLDG